MLYAANTVIRKTKQGETAKMSDMTLTVSIANYGHTTPLKDGSVTSDMFGMEHIEITPVPMIFRRMVRSLEFDVAEMALATYLCSRAHGKRFTALPIFLTHDFYHGGIMVNKSSGISAPKDLEGRKVGVRSYTLTPGVWTRAVLQHEYDVDLDAVTWVLSGDEHVAEFVEPSNVASSPNSDLPAMLLSGEVDAVIGAGAIDSPEVQPLFPDAIEADAAWHKKTGLYPISHLLVVKDALLEDNPDIALELYRMFSEAKAAYLAASALWRRNRRIRPNAAEQGKDNRRRRSHTLRRGARAQDAGDLHRLQHRTGRDTEQG